MRLSPLFTSLAVLAIWSVVLGLIVGRSELFLAAVPLVVALLSARKPAAASSIGVTASLSSTRLAEGDRLDLSLPSPAPRQRRLRSRSSCNCRTRSSSSRAGVTWPPA
jgi:uncharacterized protein (DUF58 family)